jgi:hypothetical protein
MLSIDSLQLVVDLKRMRGKDQQTLKKKKKNVVAANPLPPMRHAPREIK